MTSTRLSKLPDPLPEVLTSLPVFFLLEYLGRNPSTWENAPGFAHRVGLSLDEAERALEDLTARGILTCLVTETSEHLYHLTTDAETRDKVVGLAEHINRSRDEFLAFVREVLRKQLGSRHA